MRRRAHKAQREGDVEEIVASAVIDVTTAQDAQYLRAVRAISSHNSRLPWQWYRQIGEVHYALSRGARISGYVQLTARKLTKTGQPGKIITRGLEAQIAARIQSPYGGVRALAERYFTLMKVTGDCFLIRVREGGEVVGYDFLSADELDVTSLETVTAGNGTVPPTARLKRITLPSKTGTGAGLEMEIEGRDFLGRIWRPSAQYVDEADSAMLANSTNLEVLNLLTKTLKAKLLNRLQSNGIWYVPSEINTIRTAAMDTGTKVGNSTVVNRLLEAGLHAVQNPEDPAAALPAFVTGPAQYAESLRHITADLQIHEIEMKLRQELIDRVLMGLDVQPQDVKGMGDANHWSAWAVSDDERRVNVQPEMETMCWALTEMILRAEMIEAGMPAGRVQTCCLWYDLTAANVKTNLAEDGRQAGDRGWISAEAGRRTSGFAETDAPDDDELIRWVGRQLKDPYLATFGLQAAERIDWDKVATGGKAPGPQSDSPADAPESGPGSSSGSPNDNDSDTPRRLRPA